MTGVIRKKKILLLTTEFPEITLYARRKVVGSREGVGGSGSRYMQNLMASPDLAERGSKVTLVCICVLASPFPWVHCWYLFP